MIGDRSCRHCLFFGECDKMNRAISYWKIGKVSTGREHMLSDDFESEKVQIYNIAAENCQHYVTEPRRY